ncbi:MAG: ABC transporter ATP-binding protein [Longimonas sp.]|uniref:ABC transporter ATP-binding protein n=1 Tax=Longimonas sp. TaxID=2039626 RepID=UPI0033531D49
MIEIQNLHKSFGTLDVLEDVSLDIEDGETLAIIGRSGSGKSVLMKHIVGLLSPDRGRVLVDNVDICSVSYQKLREVRKRFGVLFQGGALFDSMTSFENVAFPLQYFSDLAADEVNNRVEECLSLVRMPDVGPKKPAELSGGMRKRVALARAIALKPKYILYDEPTSGLDPETSNTIDDLIQHLAEEMNVTSVVVTHDMHSVFNIADRAAFLYGKTLHWVGPVDDIHARKDTVLDSFVTANEYHVGTPRTASSPS